MESPFLTTLMSDSSIGFFDTPKDFRVLKGKTITKTKAFRGKTGHMVSLYLFFSDKSYARLDGYCEGLIGGYVAPKS